MDTVTVFCPKCGQETFIVEIEQSGEGYSHYWGQPEYWFFGFGECKDCGYESEYSDSSL